MLKQLNIKHMRKKELYAAPETEVLELAFEQAILDGSEVGGGTSVLSVQDELWG